MSEREAPRGLDDEAGPFWDGARRGVLMLKRCVDTGRAFHYPRDRSPFTGGATEWFEARGVGEVYACSVAYRAEPRYCIAYVRLAEGPIILTNVESGDLAAVHIGQRVEVAFREADGRAVPIFVPAE